MAFLNRAAKNTSSSRTGGRQWRRTNYQCNKGEQLTPGRRSFKNEQCVVQKTDIAQDLCARTYFISQQCSHYDVASRSCFGTSAPLRTRRTQALLALLNSSSTHASTMADQNHSQSRNGKVKTTFMQKLTKARHKAVTPDLDPDTSDTRTASPRSIGDSMRRRNEKDDDISTRDTQPIDEPAMERQLDSSTTCNQQESRKQPAESRTMDAHGGVFRSKTLLEATPHTPKIVLTPASATPVRYRNVSRTAFEDRGRRNDRCQGDEVHRSVRRRSANRGIEDDLPQSRSQAMSIIRALQSTPRISALDLNICACASTPVLKPCEGAFGIDALDIGEPAYART